MPKVFRDRNHPLHPANREQRIEKLTQSPIRMRPREYLEPQIRFAQFVAKKWGKPIDEVLLTHTQLHSYLGQRIPEGQTSDNPVWSEYIEKVAKNCPPEELADRTYEFYTQPHEKLPRLSAENLKFGCFTFDYHRTDPENATIEIHFGNHDEDGKSPLSKEKRERRIQDLKFMFQYIHDNPDKYPQPKKTISGSSWLYNIDAYRSLFPVSYIQSAEVQKRTTFKGGGCWGQFVDHRGNIKKDAQAEFFKNLESIDTEQNLYQAFPLKTIRVQAPIEDFYAHFGIRNA